ncbi:hypothetical protein NSMS1_64770 (plasmid) [Nostoc sp. MS1]|nr:hypothetical protein NSMS1_64770 [Nostoc sp. MS1]
MFLQSAGGSFGGSSLYCSSHALIPGKFEVLKLAGFAANLGIYSQIISGFLNIGLLCLSTESLIDFDILLCLTAPLAGRTVELFKY